MTDKKDPITVLSESSPVRLSLAIAMVAGAYVLWRQNVSFAEAVTAKLEQQYISRELFSSEINALRRETAIRFDTLGEQISELKVAVTASSSGGGGNR